MKVYVISDTHFSHQKLVEWGRPEGFGGAILENLSRMSGDILLHLGDFTIGNDEENMIAFSQATQGFKHRILVRGNHDHKPDGWYMDRGFDFVCDTFTNTYFGKRLIFSHIPRKPQPDRFNFNIHGHMHGNAHRLIGEVAEWYDPNYHKDVAPDIHKYAPVNLEKLTAPQRITYKIKDICTTAPQNSSF